jgi:hypothetical protein
VRTSAGFREVSFGGDTRFLEAIIRTGRPIGWGEFHRAGRAVFDGVWIRGAGSLPAGWALSRAVAVRGGRVAAISAGVGRARAERADQRRQLRTARRSADVHAV